jgi:methionyl-tRNA synthetase
MSASSSSLSETYNDYDFTDVLRNHSEPEPGVVVTPVAKRRNVLITSALPYVNNVPHLGTLIGCILSADVFARFCRMRGYNTLYVSGTDEYGTATETKALAEKTTPQAICDKYNAVHRDVYAWFDCAFDHFGRTSTAAQTAIAQDIFSRLHARGHTAEASVEQLHCGACDRFLADRFVEGTCPHCAYADARGDQCDHCGKLLAPTDLVKPRCQTCGATPALRLTDHVFLKLPSFARSLKAFVAKAATEGDWSANTIRQTQAWLDEGLQDRCITRDLTWGTPVPLERFAKKVFYVWFDAPIGYISITAAYTDQWQKWWKAGNTQQYLNATDAQVADYEKMTAAAASAASSAAAAAATTTAGATPSPAAGAAATTPASAAKSADSDGDVVDDGVKLYQFMGKDNVPFHTVIFPASLIGADDNYTLLHHCSTTEFINYEDGKFSKSRGTGVFGDHCKETGIPSFAWRYYLLVNRPETNDTVFSWQEFMQRVNGELNGNLGNFAQRSVKFVESQFGGRVPPASAVTDVEREFEATITALLRTYLAQLEAVQLREGIRTVMQLSTEANKYMASQKPWELAKLPEQADRCATVCHYLIQALAHIAQLAEPYMPTLAKAIRALLRCNLRRFADHYRTLLPAGHELAPTGEPLVPRLNADEVAQFKKRFGGKTDDRAQFVLDLRVARVADVAVHPTVSHLYVLTCDLGDHKRTVVSGIAAFYTREELTGRNVVLVCNLKKALVKGVLSDGMVLTAVRGADADKKIALLRVDGAAAPGTPVMAPGSVFNRAQPKEYNMRKWDALELAVGDARLVECAGAAIERDDTVIVDKKLKSDFTERLEKSKKKGAVAATSSSEDADLAAKKRAAALEREARLKQVNDSHAARFVLCVNGDAAQPVTVDHADDFVGAKVL